MQKNLIFYCYLNDIDNINAVTATSLLCIDKYKNVFDGQKVVYCAVDEIDEEYVPKAMNIFSFLGQCEIKIVKNNPITRESEHFINLIKEILNDDSLTFYCHNKGNTHGLSERIKHHLLLMYYFNLEPIKEIESDLVNMDYITQGIIKVNTPNLVDVRSPNNPWEGWEPRLFYDWHYSGCFAWFNNKKLKSLNGWDNNKKCYEGTEEYWGHKFTSDKARSIPVLPQGHDVEKLYNFLDNENKERYLEFFNSIVPTGTNNTAKPYDWSKGWN